MTRVVETSDGTRYTQRRHSNSNAGTPITEIQAETPADYLGWRERSKWTLVHPDQPAPVVGLPWLIAHLHGKWVLTAPVTAIAGRL